MQSFHRTIFLGVLFGSLIGGVNNLRATCPVLAMDTNQSISSAKIVRAIEQKQLIELESGPTYTIYDAGIKHYSELTALVQSSKAPISLGAEMRPYMDTQRFWSFVRRNGVSIQEDSPQEIYVYNWQGRAQGKMIFDVGVPILNEQISTVLPKWLQVKRYPAMKFSSLIYVGPFPHQEGSGWERIRWEDRAREKGCVYDERVYRELYHEYDFQNNQHITEIQISIE